MSLYQKLLNIKKAIKPIVKDATNEFHHYKFASSSAVLNEIEPLIKAEGLLLIPEITSQYENIDGIRLDMIYTWYDVDSAESLKVPWYAQSNDKQDTALGKALTYAEKYFLLKFFQIPTDADDVDASKQNNQSAVQGQGCDIQYEYNGSKHYVENYKMKTGDYTGQQLKNITNLMAIYKLSEWCNSNRPDDSFTIAVIDYYKWRKAQEFDGEVVNENV